MKNFLIILTTILSFTLSGCAVKTGNQFLGKMSNEEVSSKLVKGCTTKSEVKATFGDPVDVDLMNDSKEKWTYAYARSEAKGVNYMPYANLVYSGTNDNYRKLQILFNRDIVESFSFSSSKGETKTGLFQ